MLHLWPLKTILSVVFAGIVFIVVILSASTPSDEADPFSFAWQLGKWCGTLVTVLAVCGFAAWRWLPWVQQLTFPYLGGRWKGMVTFKGENGDETRDVTLHVYHTPIAIRLLLESSESESKTLAVQASRVADVTDEYRLYYVYENTRREGGSKENRTYRGVAILRLSTSCALAMKGDYFTDTHRRGRLSFDVIELNPWWKLWK